MAGKKNTTDSIRQAFLTAAVPVFTACSIAVFAMVSNYPGVVEIQLTPTGIRILIDGTALLEPSHGANDLIPPDSVGKIPTGNHLEDKTASFHC
jgi:hypothetical protein